MYVTQGFRSLFSGLFNDTDSIETYVIDDRMIYVYVTDSGVKIKFPDEKIMNICILIT
jgi:hypothetical protein